MKISWIILAISVVLFSVMALFWIGRAPSPLPMESDPVAAAPIGATELITLGIIPERDIFAQRRRYLSLARFVEDGLKQSTTLLTDNSYLGILNDYELKRIDGAFLGSLVAVLAMDRYNARVAVKPVTADGVSTYRGVIFVRADSPIQSLSDLPGTTLGMVRATTAGDLYPIYELKQQNLLQPDTMPAVEWQGTHDAVIRAVAEGRCEAGAAKDLRIEAYLAGADAVPLRRLAVGPPVPNNALVLAAENIDGCGPRITDLLLQMHTDTAGRAVLAEMGFARFEKCDPSEYEPVLEMIRALGADWPALEIGGPQPQSLTLLRESVHAEGVDDRP